MEQYFATANLLQSAVPEFLHLYAKHEGGKKQMISYINKLLSTAKTRHRGFTILTDSIPNLSPETMSEYAISWVKYCMVQHTGDPLKEVKLRVLIKLIAHAGSNQEFDKTFVSDHLSKTLEMCLESTSNHNEMEAALECLAGCLNNHPNWFNPHVKKIESFLLKFLDHSSEDVVRNAGKAFHNLLQSGGGGLNKINYVNNFTASFHKLCGNVSILLGDLSTDFTEIDSSSAETSQFDLVAIRSDADSIEGYYKMSQRLINCVNFLKIMLQKPFVATKIIKPKILLEIINKGLAMHVCVCQENVEHEDWHRSGILKKIQIHLLYLLQMLLSWMKTSAFPYSYTISKMLVDSMLNTDKCQCVKVNYLYFKTLNHVYIQWISIVKGIHPSFQTKIFLMLINNITPNTNKVSLHLHTNIVGSKKKHKRKAIEENVLNSSSATSKTQTLNGQEQTVLENNAKVALRTLKSLLEITTGTKKDILQRLYRTTVGIALDIQGSRYADPYRNVGCQVELFKLLAAFIEQDHVSDLISIYPITRILNNGAKSNNKEISVTCVNGLRMLEKICQPICPYITSLSSDFMEETRDAHTKKDASLELFNAECVSENYETNNIPTDNITMADTEKDNANISQNNLPRHINILSVETIIPPLHNVVSKDLTVDPESRQSNAMQLDNEEKNPKVNTNLSNGFEKDNDDDVEFVEEEVIISDEEPDVCIATNGLSIHNGYETKCLSRDTNRQLEDIALENSVIETVNSVVTIIEQTPQVTKVQEKDGNQDEDIDMCDSFVDEVIDY